VQSRKIPDSCLQVDGDQKTMTAPTAGLSNLTSLQLYEVSAIIQRQGD
jgi:hypothetical protein